LALRNSTEQIKQTMSNKLKEVSVSDDIRYNPVRAESFSNWERQNNYRTSYSEMYSGYPQLVNVHYIPKYKGFVPRIKSENMFGRNYTKLANAGVRKFDEIRFSGKNSENFKEYVYYPNVLFTILYLIAGNTILCLKLLEDLRLKIPNVQKFL
jgi:hypothetical protein